MSAVPFGHNDAGSQTHCDTIATFASPYLRADEACAYCRVSRRTLSRWQKRGLITFARVGQRLILFKRSSLDKMLESLTVKGEV